MALGGLRSTRSYVQSNGQHGSEPRHDVVIQRDGISRPNATSESIVMAPGAQRSTRSFARSNGQPRSKPKHDEVIQPDGISSLDGTSSSIGSSPTKNKRGKSKNNKLTRFMEDGGQKPRIEIRLGLKKAVGKWSTEFKTEDGIICHNFAPIAYRDWRVVTPPQKCILYERIMEKFDIDLHMPHVKRAVDSYLGQRFKDYRNKLHQYYKLWNDDEEARAKPFDNLSQEDLDVICDRFNSKKIRALSVENAKHQKLVKTNHSVGSKAFVQYREEMVVWIARGDDRIQKLTYS